MPKRRPFFSIVIPCYNDGRYAPGQYIDRLLQNIVDQDLKKSETEVIIADDHSPLPYHETLDKYKNKLNIKFVETDYNFAPGNTRQKGVEQATGKWICFADHDDMFYYNALKVVKKSIEDNNEEFVVYSDFNKVDYQDHHNIRESFKGSQLNNWVHGKFYNMDNFWKPMKLHFIKDLKTHEDLALAKLVECALVHLDRKPLYVAQPTYMWIFNPNSVSHGTYVDEKDADGEVHNFFETHFNDFLVSQIDSVLDSYSQEVVNQRQALTLIMPSFASAWMSLANFKTYNTAHYLKVNDAYASRAWNAVKDTLQVDLVYIKVVLIKVFGNMMKKVKELEDANHITTFVDWLTELDGMDYMPIIERFEATKSLKPTIDDPDRPFFSVIIACYNDGRYKDGVYLDRLLDSLTRQNMFRRDIEVILADDCSPKPFISCIRKKYKDRLVIKYIKTDYNFAPGNTRAKGVTIATGNWMCFADHDDIFYDNALRTVHDAIIDKQEKHFIFSDFDGVSPEGKVIRTYECTLNWCHGKFYNKDNFWDKYGIHFVHDLKSHEDIAICTQVSCVISSEVPNYTYIHKSLYAWTDNPQSVSHAKYTVETETGTREFLEVFYEDYVTATGYTYLEKFNEHSIKMTYAIKGVLEIMCYCYFYLQGFQFRRPDDFYKKNLEVAGKFIDTCKKTFNFKNDQIYAVVASNNAVMYYDVMKQANTASGRYIPTQTFKQWLELVSPDK